MKNLAYLLSAILVSVEGVASAPGADPFVSPATMPRVGEVDERFLSYNLQMVEVTGGSIWKPYVKARDAEATPASTPVINEARAGTVGANQTTFHFRPPRDLGNPRLRKLAAALGPAYMRVSGGGANAVYFWNSDKPAPRKAPVGFNTILTQPEWKAVIDFAHAANARLVTSFAISSGTRDSAGVWTPTQASEILSYTKAAGGKIAAVEYMNEPNRAAFNGAPKGYDVAAYGRDLLIFRSFIKRAAPDILLVGPGSVGEGGTNISSNSGLLRTPDLLNACGPVFDVFSYHFYGGLSRRQGTVDGAAAINEDAALSDQYLSRADEAESFYASMRDRFEPGKRLWITEIADANRGGNPWAPTFRDTFRYLDQLGRLAKRGVQVVMHDSLDLGEYGLLDENSYKPRPNYWGAYLWHQFMGTAVLDATPSSATSLHLYAHSLRGVPGGVALLVINTDQNASKALNIASAAERYTLTADSLLEDEVKLNGSYFELGPNDALPTPSGIAIQPGVTKFEPKSITFLVFRGVGNSNTQ